MAPPRLMSMLLVLVLVFGSLGVAFVFSARECSVGVTGSSATATARGLYAPGACDALLDTMPSAYRYTAGTPNLPVVCEYTIQDVGFPHKGLLSEVRYIVRDEGALKAVGSSLCANIAKMPNSVR